MILIIVLGGGGYYLWQNRYEYFFQGEQLKIYENEENNPEEAQNNKTENDGDNSADLSEDQKSPDSNVRTSVKISNHDCDEQCENRKGTDSFRYCLEVCGLSDLTEGLDQSDNCDTFSGFDRDVCYKNKAIKEKNDSSCKEISDEQLRESCINRVLEEIL